VIYKLAQTLNVTEVDNKKIHDCHLRNKTTQCNDFLIPEQSIEGTFRIKVFQKKSLRQVKNITASFKCSSIFYLKIYLETPLELSQKTFEFSLFFNA